jgi:SepF-like predicted cell division protein (DUF552 family)
MKDELKKWFEHIQKPNSIGNFPICPFAAKSVTAKRFSIQEIKDLADLSKMVEEVDIVATDVAIFYFVDYIQFDIEYLHSVAYNLNKQYNQFDKVILDNDPRDPFIVNGVKTTFDGCYLILVQGLKELNRHAAILKSTNYYSYWTKDQLDEVVNWRKSE